MHRRSYVSGQGFTWKNEISYASIRYMCILYAHEIRASTLKSQSRFYLEKGNSVHYDTFKTTNSMFHLSRTVQILRCQGEYIAMTFRPPIKHTLKIVIFYYIFL